MYGTFAASNTSITRLNSSDCDIWSAVRGNAHGFPNGLPWEIVVAGHAGKVACPVLKAPLPFEASRRESFVGAFPSRCGDFDAAWDPRLNYSRYLQTMNIQRAMPIDCGS